MVPFFFEINLMQMYGNLVGFPLYPPEIQHRYQKVAVFKAGATGFPHQTIIVSSLLCFLGCNSALFGLVMQ